MIEYPIRDALGTLRAIHVRWDTPEGKRMAWRSPDGSDGLCGVPVTSLPLYGSEAVPGLAPDAWIIVTEGESDRDALADVCVPAVGTVTGAASCPSAEALAGVAWGRAFILWPDNDDAGRRHMTAVGASLYRAGAAEVRVLAYTPTVVPLPKGAGARDVVGGIEPAIGGATVAWLVEEWSLPLDRPRAALPVDRVSRRELGDTGSVSEALAARGVPHASPGRTVRCIAPGHDDRHASLSILRDDRRAVCHAGSCPWSGRGVIASDILAGLGG
ncbi:MAG TPA: hypothetical protein VGK16_02055 [Candidatus Limnocylindrales bacterium]|jgi:hypothetical protein